MSWRIKGVGGLGFKTWQRRKNNTLTTKNFHSRIISLITLRLPTIYLKQLSVLETK